MNKAEWTAHFRKLADRLTVLPLVGVDIGSAAVKVVELHFTEGRPILKRAVVRPIQKDKPQISIRQILRETGISTTNVAAGLSSPEVVARPFHFPHLPKNELTKAIQLEAEQAILNGHPLNEIAIDWQILSDRSSESIRGLLAVVPKEMIAKRIQTIKSLGLKPRVMDVETLALWNAYWMLIGRSQKNSPQSPAGTAPPTVLLINIGARTTNLVIVKGRDELILMRDLVLGAQAFQAGGEKDWLEEIRDSLSYARSKGGMRTLNAAYVTGGGGSDPKVLSLLQSLTQASIIHWNPLDQIECDPQDTSLDKTIGPLLTLAIGLALRRLL